MCFDFDIIIQVYLSQYNVSNRTRLPLTVKVWFFLL